MKLFTLLAATSIIFASCGPKSDMSAFADFNTAQYDSAITADSQAPLVDVRTAEEFEKGALPRAINIDINDNKSFSEAIQKLDKEKPVYIYCLSGSRSARALTKMQELGFKNVHNMAGGYIKWKAEGKPTTAGTTEVAQATGTATATSKLILADPEAVTPEQYQQLIAERKNVVFDFYAQWCGPCKQMSPVLEKLAKANSDKMEVYKIDVDKSQALSEQLKIASIPYLLVYKNGQPAGKIVGFNDEASLTQELMQYYN